MKKILEKIVQDPEFQEGIAWQRRCFSKKDQIIKQGEPGGSLFFIEDGCLRVSEKIPIDKEKNIQAGIWELDKNDVFGEIALNKSQTRTASVIALTDGCLVEVYGHELEKYLDHHPDTGYQFYKSLFTILSDRLDRANHRVNDLFAWGLKVHDIDKHL